MSGAPWALPAQALRGRRRQMPEALCPCWQYDAAPEEGRRSRTRQLRKLTRIASPRHDYLLGALLT